MATSGHINELQSRNHVKGVVHGFVSPWTELNAGLWSLFMGATLFLALRIWCKVTKRYGLWYDDYILTVSWLVLLANNSLICWQFNNGYVLADSKQKWDEHMRILINVSSCGTLVGQAWTKTAFGVTLLRITDSWQRWVLWFCIITMNLFMFLKIIFQWAKITDKDGYQNDWRIDIWISWEFRENFKEGGNVYNIIMDFVFATFPWLIMRKLEMKRAEKIGLCITMSLGMVVAIVSAIRVGWKDEGNARDEYYIFRNGISQVWYSSEIAGTIIVQCIPILRPILREFTSTLASRISIAHTSDNRQSSTWVSRRMSSSKRGSAVPPNEVLALREIPEEDDDEPWKGESRNSLPDMQQGMAGKSLELTRDGRSHSFLSFSDTADVENQKGLSPPPRRFV